MDVWDLKLGPVYPLVYYGKDEELRGNLFKILLEKYSEPGRNCLQVGVPSFLGHKFGQNWTSIDPYDKRECIDIKCFLEDTPFEDNTFDFIVCNAILEHVKDPFACAREMYRITKPDGEVWVEVPFCQPYHPYKGWETKDHMFPNETTKEFKADEYHGGDYWRFTPMGVSQLMSNFKRERIYLINEGGILFHGRKV